MPHPDSSQQRRAAGAELAQSVPQFGVREVARDGPIRRLIVWVERRKRPVKKIKNKNREGRGRRL